MSDSDDWLAEKPAKVKKSAGVGKKESGSAVKEKKEKTKAVPAPKDLTGKKGEKTPLQKQTEEDAKVLKRQCRELGVLSHRSAGEDMEHCRLSRLKVAPVIRKHSAAKPVEILKRATVRKNKVVFMFPGLVSVVQEGKFGQLYDMDTNPKLDIDFPTGRLRLTGTHVHTKTKLMTLLPAKGGKKMQAQDFFDHMVVFSQHEWLGHADQDPTKGIPEAAYKVVHQDVNYAGGAAAVSTASSSKGTPSIKDFVEVSDSKSAAAAETTSGRAKRAASQKVKYTDEGSDAVEEDSDDEDEDNEAPTGTRSPVRLPVAFEDLTSSVMAAATPKKAKPSGQPTISSLLGKKRSVVESDVEEISDDDDDDSGAEAPVPRDSSNRRASAVKVKSYVIKDSSDENSKDDSDEQDEEDEDEEDDDEGDGKKEKKATPKQNQSKEKPAARSGNKAPAKPRPTKAKATSDSDGDEDENDAPKKKRAKKTPAKESKKKQEKKKKKKSDSEDDSEESFEEPDDDSDFEP